MFYSVNFFKVEGYEVALNPEPRKIWKDQVKVYDLDAGELRFWKNRSNQEYFGLSHGYRHEPVWAIGEDSSDYIVSCESAVYRVPKKNLKISVKIEGLN